MVKVENNSFISVFNQDGRIRCKIQGNIDPSLLPSDDDYRNMYISSLKRWSRKTITRSVIDSIVDKYYSKALLAMRSQVVTRFSYDFHAVLANDFSSASISFYVPREICERFGVDFGENGSASASESALNGLKDYYSGILWDMKSTATVKKSLTEDANGTNFSRILEDFANIIKQYAHTALSYSAAGAIDGLSH